MQATDSNPATSPPIPFDELTRGIDVCHVDDEHDVYGGRAKNGGNLRTVNPPDRGWLGNPVKLSGDRDRAEVIARFVPTFYGRLASDSEFRKAVLDLPGSRVACWCRHGDETRPYCHLDVVDRFLRGGRPFVKHFLEDELGVSLEPAGDGTHEVIS